MKQEIPEPIQKLIELGGAKAKEFEAQKITQWNEIVQLIKNDWAEIERLVKAELPSEVRDYFRISTDNFPETYREPSMVYDRHLTTQDIEELTKNRPEITIVNRTGLLEIPHLNSITVKITCEDGESRLRYFTDKEIRYPVEDYELDGSLEMALYYAKVCYENSTRIRPIDRDEIP
jgi:hypothetical protein